MKNIFGPMEDVRYGSSSISSLFSFFLIDGSVLPPQTERKKGKEATRDAKTNEKRDPPSSWSQQQQQQQQLITSQSEIVLLDSRESR